MQKFLFTISASLFLLLFAGCGQRDDAATQPPQQAFNAVQFFQDFTAASPEQKTLADTAWRFVQTGAFPAALQSLNKLEGNPSLNASQKKSVATLTEQVKKQMATNSSAR